MKNRLVILLIVGLGLTLGFMAFSPRAVAQKPPPRATVTPTNSADVPPRPTLTPTPNSPTPRPPASSVASGESRAQILLVAGRENDGRWAIVQWLGGLGDWQNVAGWQGHVSQGQVSWRVLPKDFGKGPYRWVLYDAPNGIQLCTSKTFQLPVDWLDQVSVEMQGCAAQPSSAAPSSQATTGESLYVLRVRRSADGTLHLTVHNIDTFETWFFSSFQNLQNFLTTDGTTSTQR